MKLFEFFSFYWIGSFFHLSPDFCEALCCTEEQRVEAIEVSPFEKSLVISDAEPLLGGPGELYK